MELLNLFAPPIGVLILLVIMTVIFQKRCKNKKTRPIMIGLLVMMYLEVVYWLIQVIMREFLKM